jgi:putative sigma-54 modulation protein
MLALSKGAIMNLNITFRHMDHTPALDNIIRDKSTKFEKWFGPATNIHWTCWREGVDFCSEVSINNGSDKYFAKAHDNDLYKTFDHIVNKIQNQMSK